MDGWMEEVERMDGREVLELEGCSASQPGLAEFQDRSAGAGECGHPRRLEFSLSGRAAGVKGSADMEDCRDPESGPCCVAVSAYIKVICEIQM